MAISVSDVTSAAASATQGSGQGLESMTGMDFLQLLITELSNQDPFEPMKNKEILEQLSAIRTLESNMTMTEDFKTLIASQELSSATSLIGRMVVGVDTTGEIIEGKAEGILLDESGVYIQIGDRQMTLENVMLIYDEEVSDAA